MDALDTYRTKIETLVAAVAAPTHSFDMKDATQDVENVAQQSPKKFPRAYVYSPTDQPIEMEKENIQDVYLVEAPINVEVWRYLQPSKTGQASKGTQTECDKTAGDVIHAVTTDAYWKTNAATIGIEPTTFAYAYFMGGLVMVQVQFSLEFRYRQ